MFTHAINAHGFMMQNLRRMIDEFDDAQLAQHPFSGGNPPKWILGHLAVAADYGAMMLGQTPACAKPWHKQFGMGSPFPKQGDAFPPKAELMAALDAGYGRTIDFARKAPPDVATRPIGNEFFRGTPIETVADGVTHILTTHFAMHCGQLSIWRRQMGRPPLF